jgi:hypothetical protein
MGTPEEKMKKILTLSAALMLCATAAMASGVGLYSGTDCQTASQAITTTCTSNSGTAMTLIGTAVVPAITKSAFIGTVGILDVQTASATDWWRADACRGTAPFALVTDGTLAATNCAATFWDTAAPAGNNIQPQNQSPTRERFVLGAVLYPTDAYDFQGDDATELMNFKFTMLKAKTTGTGACAGCATGACIVLNEIQMQGLNDTSDADAIHITQPLNGRNYITFQSGAPACAGSTPTQNHTWGSIKALYR